MIEKQHSDAILHYRRWWVVVGVALILLLLYGSLAPAKALPPMSGSDKFWHAATYFIVTAYFSQLYSGIRERVLVAAALIALGVAIEFIQPYFNRQFDWFDALANSVGVFAALGVSLTPFRQIVARVDGELKRMVG